MRTGRSSGNFTEDSRTLLEEMAMALTASGVPFDNDPEALLEAMSAETDMLSFPSTILSVEFSGGYATLTAEDSGNPFSYRSKGKTAGGGWT